ncbi:UvrD-helicase domain-containing protein, partial [Staphylococcus epidermidis]|uniref:UvrD-helicase domain-containing protein n=1 Tax=Staphylococcus epidermidis TaxID=1282 RepID=UPI0037DA0B97
MKLNNDYFSRNPQHFQTHIQQLPPPLPYLPQILQHLIQSFRRQKRTPNIFHFSHYQHFPLPILTNQHPSPSPIPQTYPQHFKQILLHHYQHTNTLQQKILSSIKTPQQHHANFFMVRDLNHSIYKFTQADPTLFIQKYNPFS